MRTIVVGAFLFAILSVFQTHLAQENQKESLKEKIRKQIEAKREAAQKAIEAKKRELEEKKKELQKKLDATKEELNKKVEAGKKELKEKLEKGKEALQENLRRTKKVLEEEKAELEEHLKELKEKLANEAEEMAPKIKAQLEELESKLQGVKTKLQETKKELGPKIDEVLNQAWTKLQGQKEQTEKKLRLLQNRLEKEKQQLEKKFDQSKHDFVLGLQKKQAEYEQELTALKRKIEAEAHQIRTNIQEKTKAKYEVWGISYGEFQVTFLGLTFREGQGETRSHTHPLQRFLPKTKDPLVHELAERWNGSLKNIREMLKRKLPRSIHVKKAGTLSEAGQVNIIDPHTSGSYIKGVHRESGAFLALKALSSDSHENQMGAGFNASCVRLEGNIPHNAFQGEGKLVYTFSVGLGNKQGGVVLISVDVWAPLEFQRLQ